MRAYAITPHLYMREFQMGSFTNPDAATRQKAIDLGKKAVEAGPFEATKPVARRCSVGRRGGHVDRGGRTREHRFETLTTLAKRGGREIFVPFAKQIEEDH